jgi:hypothetical protein
VAEDEGGRVGAEAEESCMAERDGAPVAEGERSRAAKRAKIRIQVRRFR